MIRHCRGNTAVVLTIGCHVIVSVSQKSLFDQEKAYDAALEALDKIYENGLLSPAIPEDIYPPAPGNPPLFTILPYPDHTDPLDRPVAVVSLRSLSKESTSEGKERVKSWCWWCAEITRRCLQDADAQRRERGERGQELRATGCALIVDLANAGMKNVVSTWAVFLQRTQTRLGQRLMTLEYQPLFTLDRTSIWSLSSSPSSRPITQDCLARSISSTTLGHIRHSGQS